MDSQAGMAAPTATSAHQQRVDDLIAQVRAEAAAPRPSLFKPAPPRPARSSATLDHRIAEEIDYVRRHLDQLGVAFAGDPILVHRHASSLQSIDLMNQLLDHLARVIECEDKALAAGQVGHSGLRARLLRTSLVQ